MRMEPFGIEVDDVKAAEKYETLGPGYYAARRVAETVMRGSDTEPFKEIADKCADEIRAKVYDLIETWMLSDLEINIQGHISRMVDDTVQALLTGQPWAMERYAYHAYSRGEEVRAAVAKHGGEPLLMKRIADLELENTRLRESLKNAWNR